MNEPHRGDVAFACASALVAELVRGGMRHACCSPGSRSTPLALALARRPEIELHVHLDERASAFFALGIAKATNCIVAVACTSGTAAAELFPAVVEASQSRMPLVLLTADRPPELRGTGANQTIDQVELFGRYPRGYLEPPVPRAPGDVEAWTEAGEAVVRTANFEHSGGVRVRSRGPVHVNCCFDEPLVPMSTTAVPEVAEATPSEGVLLPLTGVDDLTRMIRGVERGVIVVGSQPRIDPSPLELAEHLGWPVLAEPPSRLRLPGRTLSAGQTLAASGRWLGAHRPEVVLQFGAAPTTRATQSLVASAGHLAVVDGHHLDPDPAGRADLHIELSAQLVVPELRKSIPAPKQPSDWFAGWRRSDEVTRTAVDGSLDSREEPFEGRTARDLAAAIPDDSTLFAGSSMPVRDLDTFMAPRDGLRVLANRGASGIDGLVSTAMGVAASEAERTTYGLLGDLSFLHDVGSLVWSGRRRIDLVLVVVNNDGGAIFSFLPVRDLPEHERLFATPHGLDLGALCGAVGVGHARIERAGDLLRTIAQASDAGGVRVVEVRTDREENVRRHAEVQDAADGALREAGLSD